MTIGKAQQLGAVLLPARGFLPQLGRLDHGHQQLQGTAAIHFLAHDLFDAPQHAQTQWQPRIETGGQLADHASAEHQLMAHGFGTCRDFTGGREMEC